MSKEHDPQSIQQKIDAGLSREQAIEVLDRQTPCEAPAPVKEKRTRKSASRSSGSPGEDK
jgi:hypothetical protein